MNSIAFMPKGWVKLWPDFLPKLRADALFHEFSRDLVWGQHAIRLFGRQVMQPRLTTLYGSRPLRYRYSGLELIAHTWSGALEALASEVSMSSDCEFNSVLGNLYRDGNDSMGWHADDEAELGQNPIIASISLGASRRFDLKPKAEGGGEKVSLELQHGSLLVMGGDLQHHWVHQIAKTKRVSEPRINLTFRWIAQ